MRGEIFRGKAARSSWLHVPHCKWGALCDPDNNRRKAVIPRLRVAHDFSNGRSIAGFDAAAQRKRQKLFSQSAGENLRATQQAVLEAGHPRELAAIGKSA